MTTSANQSTQAPRAKRASGSPRTQAERREATKGLLLDAARELFCERGYGSTATPDIVKAAGVTRGALYHHFSDKSDLFSAVLQREAEAIGELIDLRTRALDDPLEAMQVGSDAYFEAMAVPGRAQLLLIEAPAALGMAQARAITQPNGTAELRDGLSRAMPGADDNHLDALADILAAAFDGAALAIAQGGDPTIYGNAMMEIMFKSMELEDGI
ncbi:MAG: TetR family transcriptional regulator [Pseudomonadota bacterium]